jgi:AcrR family transcriptional regulator
VPETASQPRPGPGRPSSGARERILQAGFEVLKTDGYAGMTTAKVAARAGQNKALISYHFGSKQGLVAEVARSVSTAITEELLQGIGEPRDVRALAGGLPSWSSVEPEVGSIMAEMKARYRAVLREQLARVGDGPSSSDDAEAAAVYMVACLEGLMLEQMERGETPALERARRLFVDSVAAVVGVR